MFYTFPQSKGAYIYNFKMIPGVGTSLSANMEYWSNTHTVDMQKKRIYLYSKKTWKYVLIFIERLRLVRPSSVYSTVDESSDEPKMFLTRKKFDIHAF